MAVENALKPILNREVFETFVFFFISGAGGVAQMVHRFLKTQNKKVLSFFDIKVNESAYQDIPIVKPDSSVPVLLKKKSLVVIAILNRAVNLDNVVSTLSNLGYENIVTFAQLHVVYSRLFESHYWLDVQSIYSANFEKIKNCEAAWADELSLRLYRHLIDYRKTGNHCFLPTPESATSQYFSQTIPLRFDGPIRLIDGGAFDGDTLRQIRTLNIKLDAAACFEPDLSNYNRLAKFIRNTKLPKGQLTLFPCGLWKETALLKFCSEARESSRVSEDGNTVILGVKVDDALPFFEPNYIKLDIEGAEREAITGAKWTIQRYLPHLAICLYHKADHLWEIPLQIHTLMPSYRLYLRSHGYNGMETVLYAIHP